MPEVNTIGSAISEGSRNATMSRFAGRVIKKYGDCDKAYQTFMEESTKCTPPLEASELATICTVHSVFMQDFLNRTDTLHRKYIMILPVTSLETILT